MMSERYAPDGKIWLCAMCGKKTRDQYGDDGGWDESCALNAYLVDESNPVLDPVKVREDYERRIKQSRLGLADLMKSFKDGTYKPDPELLALAEQVVASLKQPGTPPPSV
jgi:hypothetical protein